MVAKHFNGTQPKQGISCVKYKDNTTYFETAREDFCGDFILQVENTMHFIKAHTKTASKFEGFTRIYREEYPFEAIKEAVVNAVCHRDYSAKDNILVNIFRDRIEVTNPSGVQKDLTLQEIECKSNPRNQAIYESFKDAGYIEKPGFGLKKMKELLFFYGLNFPKFEASKSWFTVTFKGPGNRILELARPCDRTDLRELGLNERQIKVLNYIQEKGFVTRRQYQRLYQVSKMTAFRDINELVEKHRFIKVEGKSVSAKYFLQ